MPVSYTYTIVGTSPCTDDFSEVVVTEQAAPNAGVDGSLVICQGESVTQADLEAALTGEDTGGTWDMTSGGAGTYTYTVAATSPCTMDASSEVVVTEQAPPNAGVDGSILICEGESVTLADLEAAITGEDAGGTWDMTSGGAGTYTYTVTGLGPCPDDQSMVTVDEQALSTPTFTLTNSYCEGETVDILPTSSDNSIAGTWSPAVIDNMNSGSYIFTPDPAECAINFTLSVIIDPLTTPTFNAIPSQCAGGANPLVNNSIEGISGLWSPTFDPNQTDTYTFTPDPGQCANTTMVVVTIDQPVNPSFDPIPSQCVGESNPLMNTSLEGIMGAWTPAFNPNATTQYTFTPDASFCANTTQITVTIDQLTTPTFNPTSNQCAGGTSPLVNTSLESITGIWTPVFDPNVTTNYTFTPDPGQCADIAMVTVIIDQPIIPDFTDPSPYCVLDDQVYSLQTTSGNGVDGTWDPSSSYVPSVLSVGLTVFTFTPNPGECADVISININVNDSVLPTFTQLEWIL